ncbi:MAG: beta-mannosidase [Verrucomicrobiales bacterium]
MNDVSTEEPIESAIANWRAARSTEQLQRQFSDPDFDDSNWPPIDVPSHWQTHDSFRDFDGTLLYRADLTVPTLQPGQRRWLCFNGLCYAGDVFLDGAYVGQTEGYFTHHRFEITDLVAKAGRSILAVEVAASRMTDPAQKRNLTGWFTEGPGLPRDWNPAGIWRPVVLVDTGPVAIRHFRALCIEADAAHAVIGLRAVLLAAEPCEVTLTTEVAGVVDVTTHTVASGENRVEWQIHVDNPELWWPTGMGDQPLFDLEVTARTSERKVTDRKQRRIGFRSTAMGDLILRINNRRTFLRGVNLAPLTVNLSAMPDEAIRAEVESIRDAGFNMVRIRSHVTRHEFIDVCDELGILVWQDLPLSGSYARSVTSAAEQQTRDMIDLLSHHPSIVIWGGHMRPHTSQPRYTAAPDLRQQQIPSWNRSILDRAIKRAFQRDDPTRPIIAHSDVAPHVPHLSGSDLGLYFGWFDGEAADIAEYAATIPRLVRFVSDMGAQALPLNIDGDLEALLDVHGSEPDALRAVIPPGTYPDVASWIDAMRTHQADVLKTTIESLRVLKYQPTGGFCAGVWRGAGPGLSRALNDADGTPRPALAAVKMALQPLLPVLYPAASTLPARSTARLGLYLCNDGIAAAEVEAVVTIVDERGTATRRWKGQVPGDDVQFIDDVLIRGGRIGSEMSVELQILDRDGHPLSTNRYVFAAS